MAFGYDADISEVKETKRMSDKFERETVESVLELPCDAWPERGISQATMERYGARVGYSQRDRSIEAVYFPCYDAKGTKVIGFQKKNITVPKEGDGHFTAVGTVRTTCQLYGQPQAAGGRKLYITEGWVDMMTVYQCLKEGNSNPQYAHLEPNVVSIVNGCANADKSVAKNEVFVKQYPEVHLCFDNDERTEMDSSGVIKGAEATEAVGSFLSSDNVFTIPWPGEINDANDYYLDSRYGPQSMYKLLAFNKNEYQPEKIVEFSEVVTFEDFMAPVQQGIIVPTLPVLMSKMMGIRTRELTVTTAHSGVGKSSLGAEIKYHIADQGHNVGLMMLEEDIKKTMGRFIARRLGVHPNLFQFNRYCGRHTDDQIRSAYEWVNDMFKPLDHYGAINVKSLLAKIKSLYYIKGCKYILLDHLSLAMAGDGVQDERRSLDSVMEKLGSFCSSNDVHIIAVSHLNRNSASEIKAKRNTGFKKDEGAVEKPFFARVYKEDLRGSSSLEGVAWNIIGIDNEIMPDGQRGRVRTNILKNRTADHLGFCDIVRMNRETGIFEDASNEVWMPEDEEGY